MIHWQFGFCGESEESIPTAQTIRQQQSTSTRCQLHWVGVRDQCNFTEHDCRLVAIVQEAQWNSIHNPDWEKISFMMDSETSETGECGRIPNCSPLDETSTCSTENSSAKKNHRSNGHLQVHVAHENPDVRKLAWADENVGINFSALSSKSHIRLRLLRREQEMCAAKKIHLDLWVKPMHFGKRGAVLLQRGEHQENHKSLVATLHEGD